MKSERVSIKEAADRLGVGTQFVRLAIQRNEFPFGYKVKNETKYTYLIPRKQFEDFINNEHSKTEN